MSDPENVDKVYEISAERTTGTRFRAIVRAANLEQAHKRVVRLWSFAAGYREQGASELQTFRFEEQAQIAARGMQPRGFINAEAEWSSDANCYLVKLNGNEGRHTYLPMGWAGR